MIASAPQLPPAFSQVDAPALDQVLSKAVERGPALVGLFDAASLRLLYLNGKAQQVINPAQLANFGQEDYALADFIGPSSLDLFQSKVEPHLNVLGRWQGHIHLLNVCGNEHPVFATFTRIHLETGSRYVCLQALQPVPLSEPERARATDQDFLNALLNHLPDWIYFKDRNGRYLRTSRSLASHVGREDPRELIGCTHFDFFSVKRAAAIHSSEQLIMDSGQPVVDQEEQETLPDGRVLWVSTTKLPLYNIEGDLLGTFGVSRNITARKLTEQAGRELQLQLQLAHKLESIGMLAAGVAHEINTPTQFITDNARFLQDAFKQLGAALERHRTLAAATPEGVAEAARIAADTELDYHLAEIPRTLEQTLDGLGRVARIVGSLKEFSHPHTLERKPADINRAIETTLGVARHEWKYVADIVYDLDPELPPVPCILDEFNQVVLNLVINACHAISDVPRPAGAGKGRITLRTHHDGTFAWVEVSDTGTGIPPEIHDRIFELFFTTKRAGKGTGQGLALVRNIVVQHHGGTIGFTTAAGVGTTFRVQLPLVAPPADAASPSHSPA